MQAERAACEAAMVPQPSSQPTSELNLFAKPFTPSSRSGTPSPELAPASAENIPDIVGTAVPEGEWMLERVRKFECTGELEDYEELEELAAHALHQGTESDYTSDTGDSTDEEDFEARRIREMEELRSFATKLQASGSQGVSCC